MHKYTENIYYYRIFVQAV